MFKENQLLYPYKYVYRFRGRGICKSDRGLQYILTGICLQKYKYKNEDKYKANTNFEINCTTKVLAISAIMSYVLPFCEY